MPVAKVHDPYVIGSSCSPSSRALGKMRKPDWPHVMAAARRKFGLGNPYGVYAFGIDRKVTSGRTTKSRALNVYVLHKHVKPERAVPPLVVRGRGLRVVPDVIG